MKKITEDEFLDLIKIYKDCIIGYHLIKNENIYNDLKSHTEAVKFAMEEEIKDSLENKENAEEMWWKEVSDKLYPWTYDLDKAKAEKISAKYFFSIPDKPWKHNDHGTSSYDDVYDNGRIPYWYAFLEPPHWASFWHIKIKKDSSWQEYGEYILEREYNLDDFQKINETLFPNGFENLEIYEWTTDWSNIFDAWHEWWWSACRSIYDKSLDRFVVMVVSATD